MNEVLTQAEIERQDEGKWLLVVDSEYDDQGEVMRGRVLFHSKDRNEMYRKDMELRPQSAAYVYAGTIPEGMALVL